MAQYSQLNSNASDQIIPPTLKGQKYPFANPNFEWKSSASMTQTRQLIIDSSARNWDTQNSQDYTVFLGETLHGVSSIELVDGYIPNSGYVITLKNNQIHFQETINHVQTDSYLTAVIPIGNYKIIDLLNTLAFEMSQVSVTNRTYRCQVAELTNKVTISVSPISHQTSHQNNDDFDLPLITPDRLNGVFNLIFTDGTEPIGDSGQMEIPVIHPLTQQRTMQMVQTGQTRHRYIQNSIGNLLGFKAQNLAGLWSYTAQSIYRLRAYEYLVIEFNTDNHDDFRNIIGPLNLDGLKRPFAIVQLNRNGEYFDLFGERQQICENAHFIKHFSPPITMSKVHITIRTPDGDLYDFNGLDHYLLFDMKQMLTTSS
jgi:hypothetical protein